MLSPGLVKVAAHPEHSEPVDYQPGQLLPEWLSADLASGRALLRPRPVPGNDAIYELVYAEGKK